MWKSKKDLKIKELEHTIRSLHTIAGVATFI